MTANSTALLESMRAALEERDMWKAEADRLHRLLREQIAQNGELVRQGRKLDGGPLPLYVTIDSKESTGGLRDVLIVRREAADYPQEEVTL